MALDSVAKIELDLLLAGVEKVYGYDFRDYSPASLQRRMRLWLSRSGFPSYGAAIPEVLRQPLLFEELLHGITVNVSDMFRDPEVFRALREQVIPHLRTYPFVKVWVAGCAGGEEAYSLAILLQEEGFGGAFRIYATDIDKEVLRRAKEGHLQLREMRNYTRNYQESGGTTSFSQYYCADHDHAMLTPSLREQVVFASHNLAADGVFGDMQLVLCRNVLIYFNDRLKDRALDLLDSSLVPGGFLCLGTKEALDGRGIAPRYEELVPRKRIYRKRYA